MSQPVGWAKGLYPVPIRIQHDNRWARYRFAHLTVCFRRAFL